MNYTAIANTAQAVPRMVTQASGLLAVVACLLPVGLCFAQISLEGSGTYQQDFNTLTNSEKPGQQWTNNDTLPGWVAQQSVAPEFSPRHGTIISSDGSSNKGLIYSFGEEGSENRWLGGLASGSTGKLAVGVEFVNDSKAPLVLETLSFRAKQWRDGGGNPGTLSFTYKISGETMEDLAHSEEGWTPLSSLDFSSLSNEGEPVALNDESTFSETRTEKLNLLLNPGEHILFRWVFPGTPKGNHAFGIDDFALTYKSATQATQNRKNLP